MTVTATFNKRSLYHSDLSKAGPLVVQIMGKPRDSQYPNKPKWVGLQVQGDDTKYTYNIENESIERVLSDGPFNTWITLKAGGRGEDASILLEDANGNYANDAVPADELAQPQGGPPPNWPDNMTKAPAASRTMAPQHPVSVNGDPVVQRVVTLTLQAVKGLEAGGVRVDSDAAARMFSTIFIQSHR